MQGSTTLTATLFRTAFVLAVLLALMSGGAPRSLADDHPQGDFTLTNPVIYNTTRGQEQARGLGEVMMLGYTAEYGLPEDYGLRNTVIEVRSRHQLQLSEVTFEYTGPLYFETSNGKADFTYEEKGRSRRIASRGSESIKGSGTYDERTGEIKGSFSGEYSMYYEEELSSGDPTIFDITSRFSGEFHGVLEIEGGGAGAPSATSVVIAFTGNNSSKGKFAFGITYESGGGHITHGPYDSYFEQEIEVAYEIDTKGLPGDTGVAGGGVEDGPEEGSKIPGPGSWWEWLMGTVVAGAIAAGAGLVSTIFGGAGLSFQPQGGLPGGDPPPAGYHPALGLTPGAAPTVVAASPGLTFTPTRSPLTDFPGQYAPDYDISYGTADPFDIHGVRHPHQPADGFEEALDAVLETAADDVLSQTAKGMFEDMTYNIPVAVIDGVKDAYNWVTVENVLGLGRDFNDFIREADRLPVDAAEAAVGYAEEAVHDPTILMGDLARGGMTIIEGIDAALKDPLGIAKTILGTELWANAMDPNRPPLERLGYSTLATLRTIALIKGAMALKSALAGGGTQAAGAAAASKGGAAAKAGAAKGGAAAKGVTAKGAASKLTPQQIAAANKAWSGMTIKSSDRISAMKYAVSKGDPKLIEQAALSLKGDPLAVDALNRSGNTKLIREVNRVVKRAHKHGLGILKGKVANVQGVSPDRVRIVRATNPSPTPKIGMDHDVTAQVFKKGKWVDVPARDLQPILDQSYHQAAGSPKHITPQQVSRVFGNEAVDSHSGVAYGHSSKGLDAALTGKSAGGEAGAVAQTMQYKAQGHFAEAEKLFEAGNTEAALVQQRLGQRELGKAFNNQVKQRLRAIVEGGDPQKLSLMETKLPGIRKTHRIIEQMEAMSSRNASPLEVAEFLRSEGTTMDELANNVASIYEGLPR